MMEKIEKIAGLIAELSNKEKAELFEGLAVKGELNVFATAQYSGQDSWERYIKVYFDKDKAKKAVEDDKLRAEKIRKIRKEYIGDRPATPEPEYGRGEVASSKSDKFPYSGGDGYFYASAEWADYYRRRRAAEFQDGIRELESSITGEDYVVALNFM